MELDAEHTRKLESSLLTVVVPCFDEEEGIAQFHARLSAVMNAIPAAWEVIYVNDGSSDGTWHQLEELGTGSDRVGIVDLSRNFGKEIAMTAGLDRARGDAVIIIDADLQDPPELIPQLVTHWLEGYDTVYAKRSSRGGETRLKILTARLFYKSIGRLSRVPIPEDAGDFRLLSRRAVDSLLQLREQHRFMKGLFCWVGYGQKAVPYHRDPRYAGKTKWNYWSLWNFAVEGITSFSTIPLRVTTYLGMGVAVVAFLYALWIFYKTLAFGESVRGYPSLMIVILFLGGVQLMSVGILGEYLGRVFNEAKGRPLYFVSEYRPAATERRGSTRVD